MSHEKSTPRPISEKEVFLPEERFIYEDTWQSKLSKALRFRNSSLRILLAELLGTFVLVAFGVGCIAQFALNGPKNVRHNIVGVNIGWGMAVAFGVFVCGGVSGGHINPAVTICFALFGRIQWKKVPFYLIGQYVGAFLGALAVYLVYLNQLDVYDGGVRQGPYTPHANASTAGIWATYPQHERIENWQGFIDQTFATGLLVLMALAIIDERNMQVPKGLVPIALGLVVTALTTAYESNCGAALNPARDLGPRFFTYIAGWGSGVFSYRDYCWWLVPVFGPHLGAILGGWAYNFFVGLHFSPYQN